MKNETYMDAEILARLNAIFKDVFDDDTIAVQARTTAADIDGWDSLTHIRLVLTAERTFNVKFSAKEISSLKNVGDFVALIGSKA